MEFSIWLESTSKEDTKVVFIDLDETLIHSIPEKKNRLLIDIPYEKHVIIHYKKDTIPVFPRPHIKEFLKEVSQLAKIYIYTRNSHKYTQKVVSKLNIDKYITGIYSARNIQNINKELNLSHKKWILIDNLNINTLETINKIRAISGDNSDNLKSINNKYKNKFIPIKPWLVKIENNADNELLRLIPEIKRKLS